MSLPHAEESAQGTIKIQQIPCSQIDANDYNPNVLTEEEFEELLAEVRHLGRLPKPVVVRRQGDRLVVVDGQQGLKAAKAADMTSVPCEVIELDEFEAMRQTYKRNRHGNPDPVLLGRMFRRMMGLRRLSGRALAREIMVSEGTVRNALLYADAAEVRNRYAPVGADHDIAKLAVQEVRQYLRLPEGGRDAWLDGGGELPATDPEGDAEKHAVGRGDGPTPPDGPGPEPGEGANPTVAPESAGTAGLPAEQAEQEGTDELPLNGRPEGASGGEADYLLAQDVPAEWDGDGSSCPWESTFVLVQRGVEDLAPLIFDPDKRDRTQAVDQVEHLLQLLRQLQEELARRVPTPAPSACYPGER
jgi:hypothetical protein